MSLEAELKTQLSHNISLKPYTTMQVGGEAQYFSQPKNLQDLLLTFKFIHEQKIPFFVLGKGSNVIFSDEGFRGVVIHLAQFDQDRYVVNKEAKTLKASAGVHLSRLVLIARNHGLGGAEFLCNVPGTLGGAVYMNAGFSRYAGQVNEIGDIIKEVKLISFEGELKTFAKDEIEFSYRSTNLTEGIIVEATLQLWSRKSEQIASEIRANFDYRNNKQDLTSPSSGSIFKNPPAPHPSAGQLIDQLGLKGKRIGDAQISEKHGNYIINRGKASSHDIEMLISETQEAVLNATGIKLETEVRFIQVY